MLSTLIVVIASAVISTLMAYDVEKLDCAIQGHGKINVNGRSMRYNIQDNKYIIEGDIIIGDANELSDRRRLIPVTTGTLWTNKYVPYTIDSSLSSAMRSRISTAISHWESNTDIRFGIRNGEADYAKFISGSGCSSYVGNVRRGGQEITLSDGCSAGNIIHEIAHCIGFWHTHSREDRDQYISINFSNIEEDEKDNFDRHLDDADDCLTYDYGSIMHYHRTAFAINRDINTITPLQNGHGVSIGQRDTLSSIDKGCVNVLYGSSQLSQLQQTNIKPITSFGGNCLDVHSVDYYSLVNPGKVQMWSCNGWDNQKWYVAADNVIKSKNNKCLDVDYWDYHSAINGAKVQLWDCNGWDNQKWYIDGNQIKSYNGKCLDIHIDDFYVDGGKVQLWDCWGSDNQKWNI